MAKQFLRQHDIPSSSGDRTYRVSETDQGWECSCPAWTRRTPRADCKHIRQARELPAAQVGLTPETLEHWRRLIVLATVPCVTPRYEHGQLVEIRLPLQPFGGEWAGFLATLAYDLDALGMPWTVVRERILLAQHNTRDAILAAVHHDGRVILSDWVDGRGYTRRVTVPVDTPPRTGQG